MAGSIMPLPMVLALLTEEQSAHWKEMLGAPFKGELRPRPNPNRF